MKEKLEKGEHVGKRGGGIFKHKRENSINEDIHCTKITEIRNLGEFCPKMMCKY